MTTNLIEATYVATRPDRAPEALAEAIAREQSLEIIPELIPEPIRREFLGRVLDVRAIDDQRWQLHIGYPEQLASAQIGQLLHLLYGNVSFYPRIRLVGLELPQSLLGALPGPQGGVDRIREFIGVPDRALLMTALKPRGSAPDHFADLALRFAKGGGDLLKDDQNLVETQLSNFTSRIKNISQSIDIASQKTGRRCLYLPHVAGSGEHLHRQLEAVAQCGLAGVVLCPWVMGLETASAAAREHGLMWLAHPAMAGNFTEPADHGICSEIMLGQLVRAAGADISIFPGRGGRLSSTHDDTAVVCRALTGPLGDMKAALPCTGGGKRLEDIAETARERDPDFAVLVGGDLLKRGEAIESATAEAVETLRQVAEI